MTLKCKCVKVCCTCMAGCDNCYDLMVVIIVCHGGTYMVNICDSFGICVVTVVCGLVIAVYDICHVCECVMIL